jgi:hypothetical protein
MKAKDISTLSPAKHTVMQAEPQHTIKVSEEIPLDHWATGHS